MPLMLQVATTLGATVVIWEADLNLGGSGRRLRIQARLELFCKIAEGDGGVMPTAERLFM